MHGDRRSADHGAARRDTPHRHRLAVLAATMLAATAISPAAASAATLSATPSSFASVFSSAQAGDTILLASGSYGTFRGAMKTGRVTVTEAAGASASMRLELNPAANITIDGLDITGAYIGDARTKNITVSNSTFEGSRAHLRGSELVNANVLLQGNRHANVNVCTGCLDGRVHITGRTAQPSGITIRDSLFQGGSADGIQNGGNAVHILSNTFRNLSQTGVDGAHTDSLQLYGSRGTVIRGNFFYNVDMGNPGAYDRAEAEVFEDNVVVSSRYPYAATLLSDAGSIVRHNTFVRRSVSGSPCDYNLPCGIVMMGNKPADPRSTGTIFKDNILAELSINGETPAFAENDFNMYTNRKGAGANSTLAQPIFVGGAAPTTYDGFRLAAGSPGKGTASDGLDRGARFDATPMPVPPPTEPAPAPPPPAPPTELAPAPAPPPVLDPAVPILAPPAQEPPPAVVDDGHEHPDDHGDGHGHGGDERGAPRGRARVSSTLRALRRGGALQIALTLDGAGRARVTPVVHVSLPRSARRRAGSTARIALRSRTVDFRSAGSRTLSFRLRPHDRRIVARARTARVSLKIVSQAPSGQRAARRLTLRIGR
jgi:hypothetical protein